MLAVGDATAAIAKQEGFLHVESAAGDVEALAALALARCRPAQGTLLHVAGSHLAGDLGRRIEAGGLSYRRAVLYSARPAERLSDDVARALTAGEVDGVLFFSPRTAETFVTLVRKAQLAEACRALAAFCLSEAVAERARAIAWRRIAVAPRPDVDSLVDLLTDGTRGPWGTMTDTPKTPDEPAESATATPDQPAAGEATEAPAERASASEALAEPAPAAARPPVSRAGVISWAVLSSLVLLAVLGGALYAAAPFWSPHVERYIQAIRPETAPDPRVAELAGRVAALESAPKGDVASGDAVAELERARTEIASQIAGLVERVDNLEKGLDGVRTMVKATALPGQAEDTRRSLDELSARIARLEQSDPADAVQEGLNRLGAEKDRLSGAVADITQRVEGLEKSRAEAAGASQEVRATVLAAGQLREALRTSAPFSAELAALRKAAGDQPELVQIVAELMPHAAGGIPVLATLDDRFHAVARQAVAASRQSEADGWLAAAANRLASLVTIRRTSGAEAGDSVDAPVARAETALRDGDLVAAVQAVEGLEGPAAQATAEWLNQARARVLAERAMAVLHVHTVSLIAPAAR